MSLTNLPDLIDSTLERCRKVKRWQEVVLSDQLKARIEGVFEGSMVLYEKTGDVVLQHFDNHVIFPLQYFSLVSQIKELIFGLNEYRAWLSSAVSAFDSPTDFAKVVFDLSSSGVRTLTELREATTASNRQDFSVLLTWLDRQHESEADLFLRFCTDDSYRRGKKLSNSDGTVYKLRQDWYESIILKAVNIPDAKSGFFGELVEKLSHDPELIFSICDELTPTTNFRVILREKVLKKFIGSLFTLLAEFDLLSELLEFEVPNTETKFSSLKSGELSLTSIFWVFDRPVEESELMMGDKLRAIPDSMFRRGANYYYVSGEWTNGTESRLDFETLKSFFDLAYKGRFVLNHLDGEYTLTQIEVPQYPLNQILFGPPGTGKTYCAVNHALAIVNSYDLKSLYDNQRKSSSFRKKYRAEFDELILQGLVRFVTFHQSYAYEEFLEGIKAKVNSKGDVEYVIEDGILKEICADAHKELDAATAENRIPKDFVLVIDEINRGNISKIFGELITLIEDDKRIGARESTRVKLAYSGTGDKSKLFGVPKNLYIIGTMNTADKSVALIDAALRRRFTFIEYPPDPTLLSTEVEGIDPQKLLATINTRLEYLLDRDHLIGHAYLINVESKNDLCAVFRTKLIPLLEEYFYNDFEKIALVLGSHDNWTRDHSLRIIQTSERVSQRDVFGKDLDGFDDRLLFNIRNDLAEGRFDDVPVEVFKGIYERNVTIAPMIAQEETEPAVEE